MDADDINNTIDAIYDATETQLETHLTNAALASFGIVGGLLSVILRPIIVKVIRLTVLNFTRYLVNVLQKQIDIIEGKIIIREVNDAVENNNESDYIIAIGKY